MKGNLSETDWAYLAGFFDGEGCFWITNNRIGVTCANCYKPIVEHFYNLFGGNIQCRRPRKETHRPCYQWQLVGSKLVPILKKLIPFLIEKKSQAEILLEFYNLPTNQGSRTGANEELEKERTRLITKVKGLKHVSY